MKRDSKPFTREDFFRALWRKVEPPSPLVDATAEYVANAITSSGLDQVMAGSHNGKPVKFFQAYELVYGKTIDGKARKLPEKQT